MKSIENELDLLKSKFLYRELRTLDQVEGIHARFGTKKVTLFCSNDYLGLSVDPRVIQTFQQASKIFGVGSGASRLISGSTRAVNSLENRIAQFKKKESALVFSTGYLANLGIITSLCGKEDVVIADKLNHASILDACKLSGATIRVYPHKSTIYLEKILKQCQSFRKRLIVTDSVFSMDGDLAPLSEIVSLKQQYDALLMIDEAHGTGVFGKQGHGVAEHFNLEDQIDISMGTMSKAMGILGGFVAGSEKLIQYMVNKSRPFIFSTALPPAICAAAEEALDIIERDTALREKLWKNIERMNKGLNVILSRFEDTAKDPANARFFGLGSPIIPILIGDEEKALHLSKRLLEHGFFVPAVRYPAVPKGKARLRITVSALHTPESIDQFVIMLGNLLNG